MWIEFSTQQQIDYISAKSSMVIDELTFDAILTCEKRLSAKQRSLYVDYVSAEAARITYAKVDPSSEAATDEFYFTVITFPLETRARLLWHAFEGVQP